MNTAQPVVKATGFFDFKDKAPVLKTVSSENLAEYKRHFLPFHDGTVQLLKEKGAWTPEMEKWQAKAVAMERRRGEEWEKAIDAAVIEAGAEKADYKDKKWKAYIDSPAWTHWQTGFWAKWLEANDLVLIPAAAD